MRNNYFAIVIKEGDKLYSYALRVTSNYNIVSALNIKDIHIAHLCPTKKRCEEIVKEWNQSFKDNGTYLY
jgi:hypothetical protein